MRHLQRTSPFVLAIGLVGCLLAGIVMSLVGSAVTIQLVTMENYGKAAYVGAIGNLVLQIAIPTVCLMVMISQKTGLRPLAR